MVAIGTAGVASALLSRLWRVVKVKQRRAFLLAALNIVKDNQFLQAVLVPSALGFATYAVATLVNAVRLWLRELLMTSCTIENDEEKLFTAVIEFVSTLSADSNPPLVGTLRKKKESRKSWIKEYLGVADKNVPEVDWRPSNENSFTQFMYRGQRVTLFRSAGDTITTGYANKVTKLEKLTLSTWGRQSDTLKRLVAEALAASCEEESLDLNVYVISDSWARSWEKATTKRPRPAESVVLDSTLAQDLVDDAKGFLEDAEWYKQRGIPHRRGYLLHGPPGCGKSSTVEVIAGLLHLDICVLTLSNKNLDDNLLGENMREAPANAIILLEDVDAVFVERSVQKDSNSSSVTFSGLLNAIDGVASQEGRMLFLTTNHIDRLDPALKRPGRCDVTVELRKASKSQMRALFLRFFPSQPTAAERWVAALPEDELSMAQLQGHLLEHRKLGADEAVARVPNLLKSSHPKAAGRLRKSVWAHLRRLGLEYYAPFFEHAGAASEADLALLFPSGDTARDGGKLSHLCVEAKHSEGDREMLSRLLKRDAATMKEDYALADMAALREAFLAAYVAPDGGGGGDKASRTALEARSAAFCAKLSDEGKGLVSLWQLRRLLASHPGDPDGALASADAATHPRASASGGHPPWMSALTFLRRAGLERLHFALEDKGLRRAADFSQHGKDDVAKLGLDDDEDGALLLRLLKCDKKDAALSASFQLVHRPRLLDEFSARMGVQRASPEAAACAAALTDDAGRGLVSLLQLRAFLDRHAETGTPLGGALAAAATAELVEAPDPVRPVVEVAETVVPTVWIYGFLKGLGLEEHASSFIDHEIVSEEDLLLPDPLAAKQLMELGVEKQGEQRRLLRAMGALAADTELTAATKQPTAVVGLKATSHSNGLAAAAALAENSMN